LGPEIGNLGPDFCHIRLGGNLVTGFFFGESRCDGFCLPIVGSGLLEPVRESKRLEVHRIQDRSLSVSAFPQTFLSPYTGLFQNGDKHVETVG